jgi:regulator of sigma E protease
MSFLYYIVPVAVVLGILVLVHEFGHFAAAKLFGVRVDVFSIGFGKRLFGFRRGETDYRISALPLGGYVKMAGENPMEALTGDPREFLSHPRWQRFIIAIAGPFMNILLAVAVLTGVFMVHYVHVPYLEEPAVIGWVDPGTSAAQAGIEPGDRVIRIDNTQNPTWGDLKNHFAIDANQTAELAIQRGNEVLIKKVTPKVVDDEIDDAGLGPRQTLKITQLEPNMPAAAAGLKVGDEITAINGIPMHSVDRVIAFLQKNGDKPVQVAALRNGQPIKFTVTPKQADRNGEKLYAIGFGTENVYRVDKLSLPRAFVASVELNKKSSMLVLDVVSRMIQRKVSIKQLSGPLYIAKASGEAAKEKGWTPILAFMAFISLQLGLFNLFPIPILDGGMILMLIVEGIMRRDISLQVKERIYQAAFVFLILFFVVVMYNDLTKIVPGLHP